MVSVSRCNNSVCAIDGRESYSKQFGTDAVGVLAHNRCTRAMPCIMTVCRLCLDATPSLALVLNSSMPLQRVKERLAATVTDESARDLLRVLLHGTPKCRPPAEKLESALRGELKSKRYQYLYPPSLD